MNFTKIELKNRRVPKYHSQLTPKTKRFHKILQKYMRLHTMSFTGFDKNVFYGIGSPCKTTFLKNLATKTAEWYAFIQTMLGPLFHYLI